MTKRYRLMPYQLFFEAWRGLAVTLVILSGALWLLNPEGIRDYRSVLALSAGLGLLIFAWGFGMSQLSFVAVGRNAIVIQLPLWRIRAPVSAIRNTRMVTLDKIAPDRFKDVEMAELSAVFLEFDHWPQPPVVMAFWLGKLVLPDGVLLPVNDVIGLRRVIDAQLIERKENARQPIQMRQY
jgi:hypothetical protein